MTNDHEGGNAELGSHPFGGYVAIGVTSGGRSSWKVSVPIVLADAASTEDACRSARDLALTLAEETALELGQPWPPPDQPARPPR